MGPKQGFRIASAVIFYQSDIEVDNKRVPDTAPPCGPAAAAK